MSDITPATSLFYPYLTIDEAWLKSALLYWEEVRRIVPAEAAETVAANLDGPALREAAAAGLLTNVLPEPYMDGAANDFRTNILALLKDPGHPAHREAELFLTLEDPGAAVTWTHRGKMTEMLVAELRTIGLVKEDKEWVIMPDQVAGLYMVCLAAAAVEQTGDHLVTSDAAFASGGEYMLLGEPPGANDDPASREFLARIGVDFPSPREVASISMTNLLKFREKHAGERLRFRHAVHEVSAVAAKASSEVELKDLLNDKRREVKAALDDHRKSLDELNVKSAAGALCLSVPSVLSAQALAVFSNIDPASATALAAGGLAISGIAWWANHRGSRRKAINDCQWHYALAIKDDLVKNSREGFSKGGDGSSGGVGGWRFGKKVMAPRR